MRVLMVGVDQTTKGGMWTVAENYLRDTAFCRETNLKYIPTSVTGSVAARCLFTARSLGRILWELLCGHYDIVHIHMAERGSVYRKNIVMTLAQRFRCKIVVHMHGAEFQPWYEGLTEKRKAYVRKIVNKADCVISLGNYWSPFLESIMAAPERLRVVHNAVSVPEENRYNEKAKNLLFLGAVGKRKGVYDLLDAMCAINDWLDPEMKLLIYGPDTDGVIAEKIAELGLQNRVEYKGWLSGEEKTAVFAETAVNVLPSYNEGLPMTILETMAYGIPNIASNVAAIPEAVNADNGSIVIPGDSAKIAEQITRLMKDTELRRQKSEAAYRDAKEKFSLPNHLRNMIDIYEKLVLKQ